MFIEGDRSTAGSSETTDVVDQPTMRVMGAVRVEAA
jgi:hypothetical protein